MYGVRRAGSVSAPLSRPFNYLASANLMAQAAEQISLAAMPLVAVLLLDAGPGETGFLAMMQTLPFLLLSIPLGLLADRVSRRQLMVIAEGVRAGSLAVLLLAVVYGYVSMSLLVILGFVGACGTVAFNVAGPALVPSLVEREQLSLANSRMELARSVAFSAGPALGGALVSWTGGSAAFALATALSVAACLCMSRISVAGRPSTPQTAQSPLKAMREGLALVWQQPLLRAVLLTAIIWNMSWFILQAVYVSYAIRQLGLTASTVGFTLAAYGVGMVVGASLSQLLLKRVNFGTAVIIGPFCSVLAMATICVSIFFPSYFWLGLGFFLFGVGPILWTITSTTLRQTLTPQIMLGRVSAIFQTVNSGARPVGAALGGFVGSLWGEATCLWLALFGFVMQAAIVQMSALGALKALPPAND
jgi:predicted MFS family arabinose efflux permease